MLFDSPVFGPVHSRRLGVSLGVNLLPARAKVCSFDCIYCECGYNRDTRVNHANAQAAEAAGMRLPSREQVRLALEAKLTDMAAHGPQPDVITFAGNGEPTLHPAFADIIADTVSLRDRLCPSAQISVLSNAAQILRDDVFEALRHVDNNILKLDTVDAGYIRKVDRPVSAAYDVERIIERMAEYGSACIVQTMFLQGTHEGENVGNTAPSLVGPWLDALERIQPREVMIYTIERETPSPLLAKVAPEVLDAIADQVRQRGIPCQVSY